MSRCLRRSGEQILECASRRELVAVGLRARSGRTRVARRMWRASGRLERVRRIDRACRHHRQRALPHGDAHLDCAALQHPQRVGRDDQSADQRHVPARADRGLRRRDGVHRLARHDDDEWNDDDQHVVCIHIRGSVQDASLELQRHRERYRSSVQQSRARRLCERRGRGRDDTPSQRLRPRGQQAMHGGLVRSDHRCLAHERPGGSLVFRRQSGLQRCRGMRWSRRLRRQRQRTGWDSLQRRQSLQWLRVV